MSNSSAYNKSANASAELFDSAATASGAAAWKQEVNQRLAAHRNRRGGMQDSVENRTQENPKTASQRAAAAAARVAARYAAAPSYSQLLAGEARAVVRAAGAAAEAARNAQAAAQAVLAGLESGSEASGFWEPATEDPRMAFDSVASVTETAPARWLDEPPVAQAQGVRTQEAARTGNDRPQNAWPGNAWAGAQPRWEEALPVHSAAPGGDLWSEMRVHPSPSADSSSSAGYPAAYSHGRGESELFPGDGDGSYDAMGSATVEPVQHIPANLIEFPRELVATRKARPRLAEGPFYDASHANSQLSIFEVDPELLAPPVFLTNPHDVAPPEWASIELNHGAEPSYLQAANRQQIYAEHAYAATPEMPIHAHAEASGEMVAGAASQVSTAGQVGQAAPVSPAHRSDGLGKQVEAAAQGWTSEPVVDGEPMAELLVAPFSDRLLAGLVDGALVMLAFLAAAVVVIASTDHPPVGRMALIAGGLGLALFGMLYQYLFLSYAAEGTPGMRYARIALCTFDDDNPTREQMQQRIPALLLSLGAAGLGLIWAAVDGDNLGWHDRMTRTYQRKY